MAPGYMTLAPDPRKNPGRKVVFLLRLSVYLLPFTGVWKRILDITRFQKVFQQMFFSSFLQK